MNVHPSVGFPTSAQDLRLDVSGFRRSVVLSRAQRLSNLPSLNTWGAGKHPQAIVVPVITGCCERGRRVDESARVEEVVRSSC